MLTVVTALAVILAGCAGGGADEATSLSRNADGYIDLTPAQLADMLADKDFALVNVHIPYEGEIEGTDAHIAYNTIENHLDELPERDARIVLYCRSGPMSREAARKLSALGYTAVYELNGGMVAWQAAGLSLVYLD
jgi:rhodanese-related sulfurtransferase